MSITNKPLFKQTSMGEVNEKKDTNGYNAISTFTGAGGSCIGLKLAGFNIVYGVEFVEEAINTYKKNHKDTYLDTRDIREIKGEDILQKTGFKKGEIDLLEGSPPCASFSRMGKGTDQWNCVKKYSDTYQRTDDLFFEYIRLVDEIKPKMILAENVPDLAYGKNRGMLKIIMQLFDRIGYEVEVRLVYGNMLEVPQKRKRLIFIGRNKEFPLRISYPLPLSYGYTVEDAIPDFETYEPSEEYNTFKSKSVKLRERFDYCRKHHLKNFADASQILEGKRLSYGYSVVFKEEPCPTILQSNELWHGYQDRSISIDEAKIFQTFPYDFKLTGTFMKKWERIGRSVPPKMYEHIGLSIKNSLDEYGCK